LREACTFSNRRYGILADDVYDQNFVEIKSTAVEGAHSIYIENWKSKDVVDVESTVPKSGLFYDLWDTRQDLVNDNPNFLEQTIIPWNIVSSTGLGNIGGNTSPQLFNNWRNNLQTVNPIQSTTIQLVFSFYE
jgi:hypothetical protein